MPKFLLIVWVVLGGCTMSSPDRDQPPKIVCTTGMIADAVAEMTAGKREVAALMGPGTDPHLFRPTKESLDLLAAADIIVANGLHLEGRMQDILEKLSRQKTVLFVGDHIDPHRLIPAEEGTDIPDPHIWFDVALWKEGLEGLSPHLAEKNVLNAESAEAYFHRLDTLDRWVRNTIATLPKASGVLITAHDAFSYFGKAYNMEVIGLQGISTVAEYGIRDITNMVDLIVSRKIKAVFVESSIPSRSMEAVVAGCEKRGHHVALGGTLYTDAPGPPGSGADTYIDMVGHNVLTVKRALQ